MDVEQVLSELSVGVAFSSGELNTHPNQSKDATEQASAFPLVRPARRVDAGKKVAMDVARMLVVYLKRAGGKYSARSENDYDLSLFIGGADWLQQLRMMRSPLVASHLTSIRNRCNG